MYNRSKKNKTILRNYINRETRNRRCYDRIDKAHDRIDKAVMIASSFIQRPSLVSVSQPRLPARRGHSSGTDTSSASPPTSERASEEVTKKLQHSPVSPAAVYRTASPRPRHSFTIADSTTIGRLRPTLLWFPTPRAGRLLPCGDPLQTP